MYVWPKRNNDVRVRNNKFCLGKAIIVTHSECVSVALVIQHVTRMRLIVICGLRATLYHIFLHYPINDMIFDIKIIEQNNLCFLIFYIIFFFGGGTFLILTRTERHVQNVHRCSCQYALFLSDFNETRFLLSTNFRKNTQFEIS